MGVPDRIYQFADLEALNLLLTPLWIFDMKEMSMFWANAAGVKMWNADSLESLLARDFKSDMSETIERRLEELYMRCAEGQVINETWTLFPNGQAKTVWVSQTGIRVGDGRVAVLSEGEVQGKGKIDQNVVRDVETLRHLPVAVCKFDMEGTLMYENAESMTVFGVQKDRMKDENHFLSLFCDANVGAAALKTVREGGECKVEAELYTRQGRRRWFSISARRRRDPVTSQYMILYSVRDITEVIKARDMAKKATLKSEVMAVIAHEIRTPLHQIIGTMDVLESTSPLQPEQMDYIKVVQSSASCLMAIINDLLDYSKLENGKIKLESINFGLHGVINACMTAFENQAEEKGLALNRRLASDLPEGLIGDPNRLRQILLNLLSNALKFTKIGSVTLHVTRSASSSDGICKIRFDVEDTGVGIAPAHQKRLFQMYQQADASVSRSYGGTGLGLAICKRLVDLMGGTIGLESRLGEGSRLWFELPFQMPDKNTLMSDVSLAEDKQATDTMRRLRILVAEDNMVNQKVVRSMLTRIGHSVTVVNNGEAALDEVMATPYDIVLMDVQMPVMDGVEATRRIRERGSRIPIIGLTAGYLPSEMKTYRKAGMNDCLGKPVRLNALRNILYERQNGSVNDFDQQ